MAELLSWNNSALRTLQECGEKFRRAYIEKDSRPSSPRQVRGTVVHRAVGRAMLRKLETQTLPTLEEARDTAATEFEAAWSEGVELSPDEQGEPVGAVRAHTKDFAVDLAGFHVERVAPGITPVGVERKIIVKPQGSDIEIHGTIDLVDRTSAGEIIRDTKSAEKSPSKSAAEDSQQLTYYTLLRSAETRQLPAGQVLDYLVRTPARAEKKHVALATTRTAEDLTALVNRLNVGVEAVKRGSFVPTNPESWWCSASWCQYFRDCVYVRRGDTRPRD